MAKKAKQPFKVCASYDTETCNLGSGETARAYPVLFIFSDLRACNLKNYEPDMCDEQVLFFRHWKETILYIEGLIDYGLQEGIIPIVCAYNLMFDLQPILFELKQRYNMQVNAQSSTNVYTLDLVDEDKNIILRFWDTFHLEMNGLAAMGRTCGFAKATGEWDYSLIRTPETPLTELEYDYAKRDVQVIPAYLRYLLEANEWLAAEQFGCEVITKTSLVRQMAKRVIGKRKITRENGKKNNLQYLFESLCKQEFAKTFESYALRKACFRGGFTFTAAAFASTVQEHVLSTDVTSMHHLFINGKRIPSKFVKTPAETLTKVANKICDIDLDEVLNHYDHPFLNAIHARIRFTNLRLRKGSVFETFGIGLLAQAKFQKVVQTTEIEDSNERAIDAENIIRSYGFYDVALNATFAFGKLYEAEEAILHVNELELWNISRVYEWDNLEVLYGELSVNAIIPPDYVTLQSNLLFAQKTDAKFISNEYQEGTPFTGDIPSSIPAGIQAGLKAGTLSNQFFASWYQSTVKGAFNSIYGTMAQDVLRPEYEIDDDAEFSIDDKSRVSIDTFEEKIPKKIKVLYTYGMRIVGGSRQHLVIAMELIYKKFKDKVKITGGDTDSIKVACDKDIEPADILHALEPLHTASREAIKTVQARVRSTAPDLASDLFHIGEFEIEAASNESTFYDYHLEAWNKARVSIVNGKSHITCAGLSRPQNTYHIEHFINDTLNKIPAKELLPLVLGYNVFVDNSIAHALEHKRPAFIDKVDEDVTDYLGNTYHVNTYASIALYPTGRWLGDTIKRVNRDNLEYLQNVYKRNVPTEQRFVQLKDGKPELWLDCEDNDNSLNVLKNWAR